MTERWAFTVMFCVGWILMDVIQAAVFNHVDFSGSVACIVIVPACAFMMPNKKRKGTTT